MKNTIFLLTLSLTVFFTEIVMAADKVVIIPLNTSKSSQVNDLVGSWGFIGGANDTGIITFLDATNFVMVEDGTADAAGQDGMEIGTYTWNQATGAFTVGLTADTNGEWGLSHPQGAATISVTGNTLTYTDDSGSTQLQRLDNILIGSWGIREANDTTIITFLDSTNFTLVEDGTAGGAGQDGMEIGTYTWDRTTGAFTINITIDTNGEWGLSHASGAMTMVVTGNTLTFSDDTESVQFQRMSP